MSIHSRRAFTIHNYEAPIGQLPVELLTDIFHIGLQEYSLEDHRAIKHLGTIASTCSAWRDAALGTPSLWQRIIYEERHGAVPKSKSKGREIPRHTKDRLLAYLLRSKGCNILLHLGFSHNTRRTQAIKKVVYPHLPRCLEISLSFAMEHDMKYLLPLPGNLCRLTKFTCVVHFADLDRRLEHPPIFVEPETITLRKLTLNRARPSLLSVGTQDIEHVRFSQHCNRWPEGATFISRCHSLTTLIISDDFPFGTDRSTAPFTLPNLIHLDIVGFEMLRASNTPNLQTLIIREGYGGNFCGTVNPMPSWSALTTLIILYTNMDTAEIISLLVLNPGIKRLELFDCIGIDYIVQLLKGDDTGGTGGTANIHGTTLLPSLSLLRVWDSTTPGGGGFQPLFARRPTLRIEHDERHRIHADDFEMTVEELNQNDEPGVFWLRPECP